MCAYAALIQAVLADPSTFKGDTPEDLAWLEGMLAYERVSTKLSAVLCGLKGKAYDDAR